MQFIPMLVATLVAFFADAIKGIAGRLLVSLGFGMVTATGVNALLNAALQRFVADPMLAGAFGAVGLDWFVSTLFAAITTRQVINGLSSDAVTFWVMRGKVS